MALTNCPECGGQVSDRAGICVHCGAVLNAGLAAKIKTSPEKKRSQVPGASKLAVLDSLDHKFDHPGFITFDRSMLFGTAGSLLIILSVFLPFASIGAFSISLSRGSDGIIVIIAAVIVLATALLSRLPGVIALGISGMIQTLLTILKISVFFGDSSHEDTIFGIISIKAETGAYVMLLGTALVIAAVVFKIMTFIKSKKKES